MKKENSRTLQAEKTRTLIIEKVLELLQTKSYDQISIPALCKALNISVGAFYHHFRSKEELIYTIFIHIEEIFSVEKEKIVIEGPNFQTTIVNHLAFNLNYYIQHYNLSLLAHTLSAGIAFRGQYFFHANRITALKIMQIIEKAQEECLLQSTHSPQLITEKIFTIYLGVIATLTLRDDSYDFRKDLEIFIFPYLDSLQ